MIGLSLIGLIFAIKYDSWELTVYALLFLGMFIWMVFYCPKQRKKNLQKLENDFVELKKKQAL